MTNPNHEVERFTFTGSRHKSPTGEWVRYSDYEKLEKDYDEATQGLAQELAEARTEVQKAKAQALAEVREALLSAEARAAAQNAIWNCGYKEGGHPGKAAIEAALSTLEDTQGEERCGGSGQIHTGECREAMSGPTCRNPHCPPCQTPETYRCPGCADCRDAQGKKT